MAHTWRAVVYRTFVILLAVLCASLVLASSPASAERGNAGAGGVVPATKIVIFHPAGSSRVVTGNCDMGESLAVDRTDAWRCIVGNEIYDPCFSLTAHATSVICDATPAKPVGFTVRLSKPLPTHMPAQGKQAWMLKLGDGTICGMLTGATGGVAGQRLNYGCTNHNYVLGNPQAQGKIWYAIEVKLPKQPKIVNGNFVPANIFAISIATLWR
jgi:hypothetical protein